MMRREHKWSALPNHLRTQRIRRDDQPPHDHQAPGAAWSQHATSTTPDGEHQPHSARHHRERPGHMIHVDVKKVGPIPDGGGWARPRPRLRAARATGGAKPELRRQRKVVPRGPDGRGYVYLHSAVDGPTRTAYTEPLSDEKAATAIAFMHRARVWFAAHRIADIEKIVNGNGTCYRADRPSRTRVSATRRICASSGDREEEGAVAGWRSRRRLPGVVVLLRVTVYSCWRTADLIHGAGFQK